MAENVKASCLCGKVEVTVPNQEDTTGACHCEMCRKWGGGPFMAVGCGQEVSFSGEENIVRYDSSDWGQRGFCGSCGTHLFYFLKPDQSYIMSAGLFGQRDDFNFDHQIFIDEKPGYYDFANQTKNMTGAEVFASFAPPEE